jgi:oligoendopeptidase F
MIFLYSVRISFIAEGGTMAHNSIPALIMMAVLFCLGSVKTSAFEPFPENQKDLFHFDLKKNFYIDDSAHKADIEKAKRIISEIEKHKGRVGSSAKEFLELFSLISDYTNVYYSLYAYGEFREAINTKDRGPFEKYLEVSAEGGSRTAFVQVELKGFSDEKLAAFIKAEPLLAKYSYSIKDTTRRSPHLLSQEKEELLAKLSPSRYEWQEAIFQMAFDRTKFGEVDVLGKSFDSGRNYEALIRNPDRKVREKAFIEYSKGLNSVSDLAGFSLCRLMKAANEESMMRGFKTSYDESLFNSYLSRQAIENIFSQLEATAPVYKEYQQYKLELAKNREKLDDPQLWDIEIPPADMEEPMFTAVEAMEAVKKALAPLGPKYGDELAKLLDPKNGRLDIVGGSFRKQGAFCEAGFGFFQDNFQGFLGDVGTLAHESGHAIHHRLVLLNRGGEMFSQGPPYLTESFAMFNEYLFKDYLLKNLKDEKQKKAIIFDQLNEQMYLWELGRRAEFEMAAYDKVASGEITDTKGFNKTCMDIGKKYDIFFERNSGLEVWWIRKHHYWSVPTYYKNYVIAEILALKYFELYKKDQEGFSKKYIAMVESGMDRDAQSLLKDFLGIDLNDPNLMKDTLKIVKDNFELEKKSRKQ